MSAAQKINDAIGSLASAQSAVADLQRLADAARDRGELSISPHELWGRLEAIDDRLHDALTLLGD